MASFIHVLAVAEHLNFRHAATALGIGQSSVSARIKALEDELGILLFDRNTRGVRLTEAGRRFVEYAAIGMDHLNHAVKTAGMLARGERGSLRIGAYALTRHSFLSRLLAQYREQHPSIDIELAEGTARDLVTRLRTGHLDVTFLAGSLEVPDCHSRVLWSEPLLVVLPKAHPLVEHGGLQWADLAEDIFLVRRSGTGPQAYDYIVLRMAGRWPSPSIQCFDVERSTLLSMVAQGYGVTIVGEAASLDDVPGVVFRRLLDERDPMPFSAVWSPCNRNPALIRLLALADEMARRT
ncbi:LysR family transcriptional regulator [Mesorhizobium sp.]|uniref:LysR family transcriptional regulator n=1 Tax=Mesorhizobium sp. TaxID=1871066 RepID=UPI00120443DB|nr:LysR family transcriptional regulator [Mesorhizobium sp.]TIP12527.1 MAG: LysR family transcriptional regulator [Mesorhizobium sp.]